ncbi:MAG: hypothetical protein ACYC1D_08580 [Acidimicrobiales bacterium]
MVLSRVAVLEAARRALDLSLHQLWMDYFGLGGNLLPTQIAACLSGAHTIADYDHDLLVQALNERHLDAGNDRPLSYADELGPHGT